MPQYLFKVEVGDFFGPVSDDPWSTTATQNFELFVEAENLSQANREVERRFGNYTRCRYTYAGKELT